MFVDSTPTFSTHPADVMTQSDVCTASALRNFLPWTNITLPRTVRHGAVAWLFKTGLGPADAASELRLF